MTRREMMGLGLLGVMHGAADPAKGQANPLDLEARCHREVLQLHKFFQDWFNGVLEPTDASFARFTSVIDSDFVIISPTGRMTSRGPLAAGLRGAHGSWETAGSGKIWIEGYQLHREAGDFAVVTYEEWQQKGDETRGRLSTGFFGRSQATPNGVAWLHLHEVWIVPS